MRKAAIHPRDFTADQYFGEEQLSNIRDRFIRWSLFQKCADVVSADHDLRLTDMM